MAALRSRRRRIRIEATVEAPLDTPARVTLRELSERTGLTASELIDMIDEGLIEAEGRAAARWRFAPQAARRARAAVRLQRDLGLNLAGAALALDLLDELRCLRAELDRLRLLLPPR